MSQAEEPKIKLTSFSHGGGCGCKIAPGVLSQILKSSAGGLIPPSMTLPIAAGVVAGNYTACHETAEQLSALQDWVRGLQAIETP